jgi:hypothetical protein
MNPTALYEVHKGWKKPTNRGGPNENIKVGQIKLTKPHTSLFLKTILRRVDPYGSRHLFD